MTCWFGFIGGGDSIGEESMTMKQMFLSNYDMDYSTLVICADLDKNVILDFVNWVSLPPE